MRRAKCGKWGECIKGCKRVREWVEWEEFRAGVDHCCNLTLLSAVNYLFPTFKEDFYTHLVSGAK